MSPVSNEVRVLADQQYQYGFYTDLDTDPVPKRLSEDTIRLISAKKNEPHWLLEWRLRAYRHWITLGEPHWQNVHYEPIDYQEIVYFSDVEVELVWGPSWSLRRLSDTTRLELGMY